VEPHLASSQLTDRQLRTSVCRQLFEHGITHIFVIGGDQPKTEHFFSSIDFLSTIAEEGFIFPHVRVAAYPQGHSFLTTEQLDAAWKEKYQFSELHRVNMKGITQLCLDDTAHLLFAEKLKDQHVQMPLIAGIAGPMKYSTLVKLALKAGVEDTIRFWQRVPDMRSMAMQSVRGYSPNELILSLAKSGQYDGMQLFAYLTPPEKLQQWIEDFTQEVHMLPTKP
jgi:methylenetetrahydrofolate reductase (NADPH)